MTTAVAARKREGLPVNDFITSHPYDHGFRFNPELLEEIYLQALRSSLRYAADARGPSDAREAVAEFHNSLPGPENIILTPGTSLAYFYLFRLLSRPHGEVLCPAPSYPLFDDLAKVAGLNVRRYHLEKTVNAAGVTRWVIDPDELEFQLTKRTCAIVIVSPHNPTGTVVSDDEMKGVCALANRAGIPIIFDEVFRQYTTNRDLRVCRPEDHGCRLSLTLNGLSKSHYLPGIKAGWIAASGENKKVTSLLNALEYLSDAFLPVQDQTQAALPGLLSPAAMAECARLTDLQRHHLRFRLQQTSGWKIAIPEAGPYICLDCTADDIMQTDEKLALTLLSRSGALFHPGSLYEFSEPWLISTVFNKDAWPSPRYM